VLGETWKVLYVSCLRSSNQGKPERGTRGESRLGLLQETECVNIFRREQLMPGLATGHPVTGVENFGDRIDLGPGRGHDTESPQRVSDLGRQLVRFEPEG
jgi:hypothetical protein